MGDRISTNYPGVRYRESDAKTYKGQPDRYFFIRYKINGRDREEGLGFASEGWTAEKASLERAKLRNAQRIGEGPKTLHERRKIKKEADAAEKLRVEREERDNLTFAEIFENRYLPNGKLNKTTATIVREKSLFKCWLKGNVGSKPLKDITEIHIEKIKKLMKQEGQTPRSISYALALIRQVFNFAIRNRIFAGLPPTKGITFPKTDNRRMRFLNHKEANDLLQYLEKENLLLHDISLVSLHCGLRLGEIISLCWNDVLFEKGFIAVKDTKNKVNRIAFMTDDVNRMLKEREEKRANAELIFSDRAGLELKNYGISREFKMATNALKLNEGISDDLDKVVFHSLRHTFCSWLVEEGVDLYTVKEMAGHKTLSMTARYSHLGNGILQDAVKKLQDGIQKARSTDEGKQQAGICEQN